MKSPNNVLSVKVDEGPEFRMGACRVSFTLPFSILGIEVFHTVNGHALFLNDQFLIITEAGITVLLDFVKKQAYWSEEYDSFKLDNDEVRIIGIGQPPVFRCKTENIAQYFQAGFDKKFDGRFPRALECWPK